MKPHTLTLCLLLTAAAVYLCCGIGFGAWESPLAMDETVRQIRLPRIYTALLVGAGLSASGAALQALFENPLADPSLIGTSGGAALGVIVLLALGGGAMGVPAAAFLGALGVCLLILAVHKLLGGGTLGLLVLGFVLSAFSGAVVSMILFLSDDLVLRSATTWLSGSLAEAGFSSPVAAIAVMLPGFLILLSAGRRLDVLMTGGRYGCQYGCISWGFACANRNRRGIDDGGGGIAFGHHRFSRHDDPQCAGANRRWQPPQTDYAVGLVGRSVFDGGGRSGALADIPCRFAGRYRDCLIGRTVFYVFVYQAFEKPLMPKQAV